MKVYTSYVYLVINDAQHKCHQYVCMAIVKDTAF